MEKELKKITEVVEKKDRPIRIVQFGQGRFLRAFIDEFIHDANEANKYDGSICVLKPRKGGSVSAFYNQNCLYTLVTKGMAEGKTVHENKIITSLHSIYQCDKNYNEFLQLAELATIEVVVSNTTEAGISVSYDDRQSDLPPDKYPAMLTQFLYKRYIAFSGRDDSGLIILPLELNENNGTLLKEKVNEYIRIWGLASDFKEWVNRCNVFCNTMVDRIVSGYKKESLPYLDELIDVCEPYRFFVIETDEPEAVKKHFPVVNKNTDIVFTTSLKPYRERKVKILNGIHTAVTLMAINLGYRYVHEVMEDATLFHYIKSMVEAEIIPTIDMEQNDLNRYAEDVFQRFKNPFLNHELKSIALNSVNKWRVRVLPSISAYKERYGIYPKRLIFSLATLINYYIKGLIGEKYNVDDSPNVLEIFIESSNHDINWLLSRRELWEDDVEQMKELIPFITRYIELIDNVGIKGAVCKICE